MLLRIFDFVNLLLSLIDPILNYTITFLLFQLWSNLLDAEEEQQQQTEDDSNNNFLLHMQMLKFFVIAFFLTSFTSAFALAALNFSMLRSCISENVPETLSKMVTNRIPGSVLSLSVFLLSFFLTPVLPLLQYFSSLLVLTGKRNNEKKDDSNHQEQQQEGNHQQKDTSILTVLKNNNPSGIYGQYSKRLFDEIFDSEIRFFKWISEIIDERVFHTFYGLNLQTVLSTLPHLTAQLIAFSILPDSPIFSSSSSSNNASFILTLHKLNVFVAMLSVSLKCFQIARSFSKKVRF